MLWNCILCVVCGWSLWNSAFSTHSFGKLVFLSVSCLFFTPEYNFLSSDRLSDRNYVMSDNVHFRKMMMIMNYFCGMVDRRKAFSLIFSRDHCQRSSPSRISDTPRAGFELAQNLSSGLVEWSCAVVITATPQRHNRHVFRICFEADSTA